MSLFLTDNPIALLIALIFLLAFFNGFLAKRRYFEKNPSHIAPLILLIVIALILLPKLLKITSFAVPFLVLFTVFIAGLLFFIAAFGIKKPWNSFIKGPGVKSTLKIAIIVIIFIAAGRVMGEQLLEDNSISLLEPLENKKTNDFDMSWFFNKQFLTFAMLFIVLGTAFLFVNNVI